MATTTNPTTTHAGTDTLHDLHTALNANVRRRAWHTAVEATDENVTVGTDDGTTLVAVTASTAAVTVTLPDLATDEFREITVLAVAADATNTVTITPASGNTIGGAASRVLKTNGSFAQLVGVGTDWKVLANG